MVKENAPSWGKAIGIIMICLGGFGIFYQIYKIIIPSIFTFMPQLVNDVNRLNPDLKPDEKVALDQLDRMLEFGTLNGETLIFFGVLGLIITIPYIVAGVKLLSAGPKNYRLGQYSLILFIVYNLIEGAVILGSATGFFVRLMLVYAAVGLVFDIVLLIILSTSDKTAYGIGVDHSMESYSVDMQNEDML